MFWQKLFTPRTKVVEVGETNTVVWLKRIALVFVFLVLAFVFLVVSGMRAIARMENSVQFSSQEVLRSGRGLLILFITLILSLFYGANLLNTNSFPLTEDN